MQKISDSSLLQFIQNQEKILDDITNDLILSRNEKITDTSEIVKNIEFLKEEIRVGKTEDLPSLFYQIEQQFKLYDKFHKPRDIPDLNSPYFAYMKIREGGKHKEVFLGHFAFIPPHRRYRIVDWTNAPIAQVYYNYKEGEPFEIDLPLKTLEGVLEEKIIMTIRGGKLVRIDKENLSFIKKDNEWFLMDNMETELGGGEGQAIRKMELGTGLTDYESPDIISLLDSQQFKLLDLPEDVSLLLTGGAGSGKTTVALHRVCKLCFNRHVHPQDIMVIVPHQGLVLLSKKILSSIGLDVVKVMTVREWFKSQSIKLLKNICKTICQDTPFRVSMLKRHRHMIHVIEAFLKRKKEEILARLKQAAVGEKQLLRFEHAQYILKGLDYLKNDDVTIIQKMQIEKIIEELNDTNAIREEIFKDSSLLQCILNEPNEFITGKVIDETIKHTRLQIIDEEEEESSSEHTLDQKEIRYQTQEAVSQTIDMEDLPILLLIHYFLNAPSNDYQTGLTQYRHMVIDEAQEMSPLEMKVLGLALAADNSSITVAGDLAQKVDQTSGFTTWSEALLDLRINKTDAMMKTLNISYRCPQKIIDLAYFVLGPLSSGVKPVSKKQYGGVIQTLGEHEAHILLMISEMLGRLMEKEPRASIAIICHALDNARRYKEGLKNLSNVRLVEYADFSFKPGVDITTIEQVKGLEFDYVIIPDLDWKNYPVNDYSRRRLHLAITRAIYQLWILAPGSFSPLIPL